MNDKIVLIVMRAIAIGERVGVRLNAEPLKIALDEVNRYVAKLDFQRMMEGKDSDLLHDIIGIDEHYDRVGRRFTDCWWPRFALREVKRRAAPFDGYEIGLCFLYGDAENEYWERYDHGGIRSDADHLRVMQEVGAKRYTWTLYGHREGEGATAFFDAQTLAEVVELYESITGLDSEIDPDEEDGTVFFLPAVADMKVRSVMAVHRKGEIGLLYVATAGEYTVMEVQCESPAAASRHAGELQAQARTEEGLTLAQVMKEARGL